MYTKIFPPICITWLNLFKNYTLDLDRVYVTRRMEDNSSASNNYGGRRCQTGKCLATMTIADMTDLCDTYCKEAKSCVLYAIWDYPQYR
ncbi:MAG: hypothetical protein IKS23_05020 [Alphaproteobacteria bacterium]|nr:hypothetical protein [Alphaproteobacteria bacterium]